MPYLFEITFPQIDMNYLQDCKQVVQFTLHEDLQHSTKFAILLYDDIVMLQADDKLYSIFILNQFNTISQVLDTLQFDYHQIDITSNILTNHVTSLILSLELQNITPITMNIYTSKFILQSMLSNTPLPVPQIEKEQVRCALQKSHIAVQCAESVLE
jgi:hypothetical protein